jgi:DNA polymerase IV
MIACFVFAQAGVAVERARAASLVGEAFALHGPDNVLQVVSEQAEQFGVRPGQRVIAARSLCPSLLTLPYDRPAYEQAMQVVWDAVAVETSLVEPVSPELVYAAIDGRDVAARTRALAAAVAERLGIAVSVGIARTKLAARQAARTASGTVVVVPPGTETAVVASVPIGSLDRIDPAMVKRLARLGVRTLGDVHKLPSRELQRQCNQTGWLLQRMAGGEDGEPVRPLWPPRVISKDFPFEEEATDRASICHALVDCSQRIARSLARGGEYCRLLRLSTRFASGACELEEETLRQPTHACETICSAGMRLFERMTQGRSWAEPIVEVVLTASGLGAGSGIQLSLLDDNEGARGLPHERSRRLEDALFLIRSRFGLGAIAHLTLWQEARRIDLWRTPFARRRHEHVRVESDRSGAPFRCWRGSRTGTPYSMEIKVRDAWKEAAWFWGESAAVYLVESAGEGVYEIRCTGDDWYIAAIAD